MTTRTSNRSAVLFVIAVLIVAELGCALFSTGDSRTVTLPLITALLFVVPTLLELCNRNGGVPFDDIGALYISAVTLYLVFPIAAYLARGLTFTPYSDGRLYYAFPSPSQIAAIEWRYVAYIVPLAIVYLLTLSRRTSGRNPVLRANPAMMFSCVFLLTALEIAIKLFSSINRISGANYEELMQRTVEVYRSLPYIVVQLYTHCESLVVIAQAATLVFLFRNYRKYRLVLLAWLILEMVTVVAGLGSRSPLVWLMLMMVILYDRFVKRIRPLMALAGALLFLLGYLGFGFVRGYSRHQISNATLLTANNEFEALFANAFDLYRLVDNGMVARPPAQVYVNDLISPIPSQLLPFEKLDGAIWYTRVLGIENTGAAYGFGVMAESAIGLGWLELVLKGALIAYMLSRLQRWYKTRSSQYWVLVIYLYLEVSCYWLFRTSSLYFIPLLFFNVLPFYLAVRVLSARPMRGVAGSASGSNSRLSHEVLNTLPR